MPLPSIEVGCVVNQIHTLSFLSWLDLSVRAGKKKKKTKRPQLREQSRTWSMRMIKRRQKEKVGKINWSNMRMKQGKISIGLTKRFQRR